MCLEERAIKNCAFVLAAFPANIEVLKSVEIIADLSYGLPKVVRFKTHRAYLDYLCIHMACNHFIKQLPLVFVPQVGKTDQTESLANVLHPQPLIIAKDSP